SLFFFQAEDGIRYYKVTGVQTCALPILETCIRYANERKQAGQSIGKFQLVATKIVDMKLRVESSRHMLYHCAWLSSHRKSVYLRSEERRVGKECRCRCAEKEVTDEYRG